MDWTDAESYARALVGIERAGWGRRYDLGEMRDWPRSHRAGAHPGPLQVVSMISAEGWETDPTTDGRAVFLIALSIIGFIVAAETVVLFPV